MKVLNQRHGKNYSLYNGDSIEVVKGLPANSIDLTLFSPPFSSLYLYSSTLRDMGNCRDDSHFFENFDYLIPELWRVTVPGRWCVLHVKHLPLFMHRDEVAGLRQFPEEITRRMTGNATEYLTAKLDGLNEALQLVSDRPPILAKIKEVEKELLWQQSKNWVFHGHTTIWKCPKREREKTNNHGLLHSSLCKDASMTRVGMAEFMLYFRKWDADEMDGMMSPKPVCRDLYEGEDAIHFDEYVGENPPIGCKSKREFSIHTWRKVASPVWDDIRDTRVLNSELVKQRVDGRSKEGHVCPLARDICERIIKWGSLPGEVVLDPFNGIGTTGYEALLAGRKYIGIELSRDYFEDADRFLSGVENANQIALAV